MKQSKHRQWLEILSVIGALFLLMGAVPKGIHAAEEEGGEQAEFDTIKRNDNIQVPPTKITGEDYLYVVGNLKGHAVKVPSWAVDEVIRSSADMHFASGMEKKKGEKHLTAAKYFKLALDAMSTQKWAVEYCNYFIGDSFYYAGRFDGYTDKKGVQYKPADYYFDQAMQANPKSRFLLDAAVKKAICLSEKGNLAEAEKAFADAESKIKAYHTAVIQEDTKYLDLEKRADAHLRLGQAIMMEKQAEKDENKDLYEKAARSFKRAQGLSALKFKDIYAEAFDGEMRVLLATEDYSSARDKAQGVIDKFNEKADAEVIQMLPGAYTVLGVANYKKAIDAAKNGQTVQAENMFAEARWNFLHVVVQFFDNYEYVAKAHFFAGLCYDRLKEKEKGGAVKSLRHWKTIVRDYPKSKFATLAEKKLGETQPANESGKDEKPAVKEDKDK